MKTIAIKHVPRSAFLLLTLSGGQAVARDVLSLALEELGRLPITAASGFTQPRTEAPAATAVLTAAQWEALGATSVYDALQLMPGLYVQDRGGAGRHVVVQGLLTVDNSQVLWLLDGLPLNSLGSNGPPPTFDRGLAGLARIEVIRGPASVIHGSSAFSAVINLVSQEAGNQDGNRVRVRGGSFDTRAAEAELGGEEGDWRWRLSLEKRLSDGDPDRIVRHDLQSSFDALFGTQASLAPGPLPAQDDVNDILLNLSWRQSSLQYWRWRNDAGGRLGNSALDPGHHVTGAIDQLVLRQAGEFSGLATRWELEGQLQRQESGFDSTVLPPGAVVPIGADGNLDFAGGNAVTFPAGLIAVSRTQTDRQRLALNLLNTGWSGHTLRLSLGREWHATRERESRRNFGFGVIDGSQPTAPVPPLPNLAGTPLTLLPDADRQLTFVALQDDWHLTDDVQLNLGLRHDRYSDFGASTSPRASLQWQATGTTRLRLGYGSAFRAPGFAELYTRNNPAALGNPALDAEELHSGEVALEQTLGRDLRIGITAFRFDARGLIEFAPRPPAFGLFAQNLSGREGEGGTVELGWQPRPGVQLNANATVWRTQDKVTGAREPLVPGHMASLNGWWEFAPGWTLGGAMKHAADRRREVGDPRAAIDDNSWADLHLHTTRLAPGLRLGLTVQNVVDADLRDPTRNNAALGPTVPGDIPLDGRSVLLEASYAWGQKSADEVPERTGD